MTGLGMTTAQVPAPARAGADWLALREPADAAARSTELADALLSLLPSGGLVAHDLGSGTGAMGRWLAPRLPAPQRWILHDHDTDLLDRVELRAAEVETRPGDITRLDPADLADADLVTASALLDMMTAEELQRFVHVCGGLRCPVLVTLSVVGRVELRPAEPIDAVVAEAFNAHQRRHTARGRLLGPDAVHAAVRAFTALGRTVAVRPSPWSLGPEDAELTAEWFVGWLGAAVEQQPTMAALLVPYARRRLAAAAAGSLSVTVHHQDFLVTSSDPIEPTPVT